jgi:hypothetical protein
MQLPSNLTAFPLGAAYEPDNILSLLPLPRLPISSFQHLYLVFII